MTALVPLANGFEDIEAITIIDVLRRGGVEVTTASITDTKSVLSAHNIRLEADALFSDVKDREFEVIVLPGGGEGTQNLKHCEALLERIRQQREAGKLLAAICAAPTVLEEAEVIEPGVHVTCYPSMYTEMLRPVNTAPVVVDQGFITGNGPGAATMFSLVLLSELAGERTAAKVARAMLAEMP